MSAQNWNVVKASPDYIYGEGMGNTIGEADQQALSDLTSKISIFVQSDFEEVQTEKRKDKKIEILDYVSNRIRTYSRATLNNTERIVLSPEPKARVGRFIKKAEVDTLFKLRLQKAQDMVRSAQMAEQTGQIDNALRYYYWSYLLTTSLRFPSKAKITTSDGKEQLMMTWIPEQIRNVMDGVQGEIVDRQEDDIFISFTFRGKPVANLDFTYFDGRDWCPVTSASDGNGMLEMAPGFAGNNIQIRLEYEYRADAHIDPELEGVMNVVSSLSFPKASKTFKNKKPQYIHKEWNVEPASTSTMVKDSKATFAQTDDADAKAPTDIEDNQHYVSVIQKVLKAVNTRQYNNLEKCFTPEGHDIFQKLIQYGKARITNNPQPTFHVATDGVICRGVQMAFTFKNGARKTFVEDVVFTFNADKLIKNISFGLGQAAEQDILCKGVWDERVRVAIMQFLENYKTAYALKRIDYLRTLFDDNAVIIVGNVAYNTGVRGMSFDTDSKRISMKNIKYSRYDKETYLKNLAKCFANNEFVNIRFASNNVIKQGKGGELYSIQIEQDYYSSSYGDHGYLFLMVDLNDAEKPRIMVRAWQPERDPKFGLYGPGDFK